MFPSTYFSLFPAFPRNRKVFVAMSFDSRFSQRYIEVIEPALSCVEVDGQHLEPYRVDARTISDSILTEILSGIGNSRLIFADVSTIEETEAHAIRNGNVMYEVGIAHAMRQPEEVLLFRSDSDRVLFDVANIRLNSYSPESSPEEAEALVVSAAKNALAEIDLRKSLAIQQAADTLDNPSWMLLAEVQNGNQIPHPEVRTMRQILGNSSRVDSIQRLLDVGAIRAAYLTVTPDVFESLREQPGNLLSYECTPFGSALFLEGVRRIGLENPAMVKVLEQELKSERGERAF